MSVSASLWYQTAIVLPLNSDFEAKMQKLDQSKQRLCLLYIMIGSSNDQAIHHHTPVGQTCSWQHWSLFKGIFEVFALMAMIGIMVAIMSGTQRPHGIPFLVHGLVVQKIQIIKFPIWTKNLPTYQPLTYHLGRLSSSKSYSNQHITTIITSILSY